MILIDENKYTQNALTLQWRLNLDTQDLSGWSLLCDLVNDRTEKYPTREAYAKAKAHAYNFISRMITAKYGKQLVVEQDLRWLREDLVDQDGYEKEIADLLEQVLRHPVFSEEYLEEARFMRSKTLLSLEQDPDSKAYLLATGLLKDDSPLSIPNPGTLEGLDQVTLEQIKALHARLMEARPEIIFCGQLTDESKKVLDKSFKTAPLKQSLCLLDLDDYRQTTIKKDISQGSLCQIYQTRTRLMDDDYFPLLVLNEYLGAGSASVLFRILREEHSLCYSISSSLQSHYGALIIETAAASENLPQARTLIRQIIEKTASAEIDESVLEMSKLELVDRTLGVENTPGSKIGQAIVEQLYDHDVTIPRQIEQIRAVQAADVARAAARLKLVCEASVIEKGKGEAE